jgi:hypothetical protein
MPGLRAIYLTLLVTGFVVSGAGLARDEQELTLIGFAVVAISVGIGLLASRVNR